MLHCFVLNQLLVVPLSNDFSFVHDDDSINVFKEINRMSDQNSSFVFKFVHKNFFVYFLFDIRV